MWDGLDSEHKSVSIVPKYLKNMAAIIIFISIINIWNNVQVYKQKTEVAKKEYLKALAAYRASLVSKV